MRITTSIITSAMLIASCQSPVKEANPYGDEQLEIREDFRDLFDSCGVQGTIVLYDYNNKKWIVSDTAEAAREGLPASTFKIPNLLIALEAGLFNRKMIHCDGREQPIPLNTGIVRISTMI